MNINEIESVCAVDIYKNYVDAAFQINVAPSVISKHISKVEEEIGVKLFDRASKSKGATLTKAGESILPLMHSICNLYNKIESVAAIEGSNSVETLKIGYAPLVGGFKESDIISRFLLNHTNIQIIRTVAANQTLVNLLRYGNLDAILMPTMGYYNNGNLRHSKIYDDPDFECTHLYSHTQLKLCVSKNHRLAKQKLITKDQFDSLKDETFIFSSAQADTFGTHQKSNIKDFLGLKEIKMRFVDYTEPRLPLNLVASGAAVMPNATMETIENPDVVFIPMEGWEMPVNLLFVQRKDNSKKSVKMLKEEALSFSKEIELK